MASEKKVVLLFTACEGAALTSATSPALAKLVQKGAVLTQVNAKGDIKKLALAGAESGESLVDAAAKQDFTVGTLTDDLCVMDLGASAAEVESALATVLEAADRTTLIVLVAKNAAIFYGPGIAKGKSIDKPTCACTIAPTVAYVANFPVPEQCEAPIAYTVLKDVNFKLNEIKKLQEAVVNIEAALERKSRQPWDKHDCA